MATGNTSRWKNAGHAMGIFLGFSVLVILGWLGFRVCGLRL
jgi:hypothetical protein